LYAIIRDRGMQYRVQEGQVLDIALQSEAAAGSEIVLNEVLLVGGEQTVVGAPLVAGAQVTVKVVGLVQDDKIVVFRYKSKKRYRRRTGHRQDLTRVQVTKIELGVTETVAVAVAEEAKPAKKSRAKAAASA
jgi:large subunit ribosomal protein L21